MYLNKITDSHSPYHYTMVVSLLVLFIINFVVHGEVYEGHGNVSPQLLNFKTLMTTVATNIKLISLELY